MPAQQLGMVCGAVRTQSRPRLAGEAAVDGSCKAMSTESYDDVENHAATVTPPPDCSWLVVSD